VLAQQAFSFVINERPSIKELYNLCRGAYPYTKLKYSDYMSVIKYLAGEHEELGKKRVYGKIWINDDNTLAPRGKLARMIYHTNVGTIPEEARITVKKGDEVIGYIDEPFLEKLSRGDVFVLGGSTYMFRYARGMTAQVTPMPSRPPTIPRWYSEMLPLSYELGKDISVFLEEVRDKIKHKKRDEEIVSFIQKRLFLEKESAKTLYHYILEQYKVADVPSIKRIIIERYKSEDLHYVVYHSRFGRRVNDVLSRISAYVLSHENKTALDIAITDYGFTLSSTKRISKINPFPLFKDLEVWDIAEKAIENTEILKRRFRHCAARALMILRRYKSSKKSVGRQQVSSKILLSAARSISRNFPIIKEAKREVLEDAMDVNNLKEIIKLHREGKLDIVEAKNAVPSPFAFNLLSQYASDSITAEDRHSFMMRLNRMVQAKIALEEGKKTKKPVYYETEKEDEKKELPEKERVRLQFTRQAEQVFVNPLIKREIEYSFFKPEAELSKYTINWIKQVLSTSEKTWPDDVIKHLKELLKKHDF
jgi:ATP-dependent Lhr-like helicase